MGARAAVQGGSPPSPCICPCAMGARGPSPPPPARARFACTAGEGGVPSSSLSPSAGGVPGLSAQGLPPVTLLRASGARCWVGGSPPPSSPLRPLVLGAGCLWGGGLVAVRPVLEPRAPSTPWGLPSGSSGPPCGEFPRWSSRGSPPAPSLRAMGALCWVGVPPLLPPPLRPLALSVCNRLGGGALLRCFFGRVRLRSRAPWGFVPSLLPLCVSDRRRRPRSHWSSH